MSITKRLPAEWEPQSGIMLTWPHTQSDWAGQLVEIEQTYSELAREISLRELLLVTCFDKPHQRHVVQILQTSGATMANIRFAIAPSDDIWSRDHGPIGIIENDKPVLLNFTFNGWGGKYPAEQDNRITCCLQEQQAFNTVVSNIDFVLEGGSIETDGHSTLLTTTECLLSPTRNPGLTQLSRRFSAGADLFAVAEHTSSSQLDTEWATPSPPSSLCVPSQRHFDTLATNGNEQSGPDPAQIEMRLRTYLGIQRILWLNHGHLAGDDTDGHIDTLARFCNPQTIAHVSCDDPQDEHYAPLQIMAAELAEMRTTDGRPYDLIPLPLPAAIHNAQGQRLPATYANFLIINGAVLVPTYAVPQDASALAVLQSAFPEQAVISIDCRALIRQFGSLHCITMQFPRGVLDWCHREAVLPSALSKAVSSNRILK